MVEKNLFQNINKYKSVFIKAFSVFVLLCFNWFFSQIFISESTSITITADVHISSNHNKETLVYVLDNTEVRNIDILSNAKIAFYTSKKQEVSKERIFASNYRIKKNTKIIKNNVLDEKNKNLLSFKSNDLDHYLLNSSFQLSNAIVVNTQYYKMVAWLSNETNYIFNNVFSYIKSVFFYSLEKSNSLATDFCNIRPPPFHS